MNINKARFCGASLCLALTMIAGSAHASLGRPTVAPPEQIVRAFYSFYLHELNRETWNPLKRRATALKYLTPQLYANAPRLIRRMDADIFICAQDWDKGWEQHFTIDPPSVKGVSATTLVTLPVGETDKIKIKVTLRKIAVGWRIDKVACAN
jgi:Protein of unknown function (DUF3828)